MNNNKTIKEDLKKVISHLKDVLNYKARKQKLVGIKCAYYVMKDLVPDNIVYNNIKDYYKNLTLGGLNVSKRYVNYLIELVKIELERID